MQMHLINARRLVLAILPLQLALGQMVHLLLVQAQAQTQAIKQLRLLAQSQAVALVRLPLRWPATLLLQRTFSQAL